MSVPSLKPAARDPPSGGRVLQPAGVGLIRDWQHALPLRSRPRWEQACCPSWALAN